MELGRVTLRSKYACRYSYSEWTHKKGSKKNPQRKLRPV